MVLYGKEKHGLSQKQQLRVVLSLAHGLPLDVHNIYVYENEKSFFNTGIAFVGFCHCA
jgi:hypothetical protein